MLTMPHIHIVKMQLCDVKGITIKILKDVYLARDDNQESWQDENKVKYTQLMKQYIPKPWGLGSNPGPMYWQSMSQYA